MPIFHRLFTIDKPKNVLLFTFLDLICYLSDTEKKHHAIHHVQVKESRVHKPLRQRTMAQPVETF